MAQPQPPPAASAQETYTFTSLDAKIAQYKYAIHKTKLVITRISVLQDSPDLLLVHYIIPLCGSLFAISDQLYATRLQKLANYQPFKPGPLSLSSSVTHIPYDSQDQTPDSLQNVPSVAEAQRCLKTLSVLCHSALQGYQKRLQQAMLDPSGQTSSDHCDKAVAKVLSSVADPDLALPPELVVYSQAAMSDNSEATLMDIDIRTLVESAKLVKENLNRIRPEVLKLKGVAAAHQQLRERTLRSFEDWQCSLHVLMVLATRLNELYSILRKIGRQAYLTNYQHLYDQRLLFQSRNPAYFRQHVLKDIDLHLNSPKKNGSLIATLTRLLRQSSLHPVDAKTVADFAGYVNQGLMIVDKLCNAIEDFSLHWIAAELRFRKVHNLPVRALLDIYNTFKGAPEPPTTTQATQTTTQTTQSTQSTKPPPKQPDSKLNDSLASLNLGTEQKTRSSRSSSVSSTSSITSNTARNVPGNRASMVLPLKTSTPPKPRPSSAIFMNSNSSIPTISTTKPETEAKTTTPTGRRRSNSQPIRSPLSEEHKGLPTVKSPPGSIQSPVGSLRRSLSLTKRNPKPQADPFVTAPIAEEPEPQLTATQRLQAHLRLAAKTGALMTQEKEILSSVVFDPNDPSSVNLGRKSASKDTDLSASAASAASKLHPPSPSPTPPTLSKRDQVTRQNTRKNSVKTLHVFSDTASSVEIETRTTSSESSVLSSGNSSVVKKVRFTGVPEYSEAEDAPSKYLHRLLKNFAVFKTPSPTAASFRKRDQLLREESQSFKTHVKRPD